jgi:monofunctional biosynthetic peptidoglycan transglycosylase
MALRQRQSDSARVERYRPVPMDSIAKVAGRAVMTGEDERFRTHGGIDYLALLQALGYRRDTFDMHSARDRALVWPLLRRAWGDREKLRGASTITQQLAKNLYLSPSRNPLRKVKEAFTAWHLEAALGQDRILELYLNVVELGDGMWGVEAASRKYFGHSARTLNESEAAALAATLPFPLSSNPGHRPGRMRWRQNLILRRLHGDYRVRSPRDDDIPEAPSVPTLPESPLPDSVKGEE